MEPTVVPPSPAASRVDGLLAILWERRGTDLLLTAGLPPQIRVNGELLAVPRETALSPADIEALLAEVLRPEQLPAWRAANEYDFAFSWRDTARIRGNAFSQRSSPAAAFRMIPREVPTMSDLGLPPVLYEFARRHHGLVLVTGPTGSGKSTTLAAVLNQINSERACHIVTIEDPIEYVHQHQRAVVDQREVGTDTDSFLTALRSVLREDPDVLLVGEMRDLESIRFALTIAETGHLVFATLHTNDTAQALARIIDAFPGDQQAQIRTQLAAALTGIVYQRLIPRQGQGLVAAFEVLVATSAVRNLVKEGKTHQLRNSLVTGQKDGMITFERSLSALVRTGQISYEDAVTRSLYPKDLAEDPRVRRGVKA
ncbi:type IV pilus twitching motility protein PilT [Amycolatopsis alkalitolerans]|uniref:Type IV pilus twitching motility protein PilT n=1 Tax=Amycolatopsis alkalitolerans TaxID=2547244 RepID=A0A5C4M7W9_9PSEU|nr:type IV pilus twitching motility protein PilT [Amycolatopsis alkalitolerans]TNC29578.1 type IV pilus twitching motility protein PilT [Amycolatopsis alkalitolerans]